ncbi:pneumococcal serine-rich repeat protein-like isoform X1 [Drosophila sulfurigaster albostrigata]|uniref:pneumococcal serine-rich repeat protein-like isoform X1 n=2 Tax=Drosophila sulfurigaster albostrigata TaxID=89887 RepID=UPI002D2198F9|nr:pneumococcal serine-rich repeat protein-like isoform X1 [Drosophila sulfurigaster albostrigata]
MSTISENEAASTEGESTESTLQQLKAKKNKSNLFLIKSYSFIDKTNTINNNNNNNNINNNNNSSKHNNNNISRACAKLTTAELLSPDLDPFVDISSLVLSQPDADKKQSRLKKPKKQKPPKTKTKSKAKTTKQPQQQHEVDEELEISEQEAMLLRRNAPHEYEELLQHLPNANGGSLPRPQSLPAKVHLEAASSVLIAPRAPTPAKRLSNNNNNIKRESFLRQSLQSIRRSFGSNKHSSKLAMIAASTASSPTASPLPSPSPKSRVFSNGSTTSSASTTSSTTSSCSSSAAISLLMKAQAHNHILDEFLPTPVVLLLNDHSQDVGDAGRLSNRSTSSVVHTVANGGNSVTDERASTSMAPLQLPSKGAAAANANAIATAKNSSGSNPTTTTTAATRSELSEEQRLQLIQQQQLELQQRRLQYIQQLSLPETFDPDDSSLPQSYANSGAPLQPSGSAHSLGSSPNPSPRSNQSKAGNGGGGGLTAGGKGLSTAKHDQQTSAAAAAAISSTSAAAGTSGHHHSVVVASTASASATTGATAATATPPEKEKKRKEVSSSRVKKFHRHFSQVSKDEKLINYFSCALVGDIPLQGHLYITEQHFAFYSNVFGYVTKVVIPTSSVTKISKEKTAKIIPNAVGVATADERHVFGSFISREAAFRLMCTVCTQLATGNEILPKPLPVDVELPEEYLLDDDSSCSISGNESPPHLRSAAAAAAAAATEQQEMQLRQRNIADRHSDLPGKSTLGVANELDQVTIRSSAPPIVHYEEQTQQTFVAAAAAVPQLSTSALPSNTITATTTAATPVRILTANATATTTTASASTTSSLRSRLSRKLPTLTELHVLYLGIMLAIMLALFSVFLLYRILDIEAKTHLYNTPVDFNLRSGNDDDIFADALRWQKELQDKSTAEAQHILSKNLEQISKVRRSLETLSMLIHDRRAGYVQPETATQMQMQMDLEATDGGSSTISSTSSAIPID